MIPATAKTPEQNMFSLLTFGSLKFGFPERTFTRPCKKNNITKKVRKKNNITFDRRAPRLGAQHERRAQQRHCAPGHC